MKFDTDCLHAGYRPKNGQPRNIPIIQSTTFRYETSQDMAKLFDLDAAGYFYSRLQNPTSDAVAARLCALEGGAAGMLLSSGQAASFFSIFNLAGAGDHVVCSSAIYGGTYNLFAVTMKRMGIQFTFVDPDCTPEQLDAAFQPNTKALFGETLANPALTVLDLERFAAAAHAHGVPFIVDNTFATPWGCRPFEWGADIVIHSTTKYLDGHAAAVGGAIIDSGNFDWQAHADKYPGLTTPDESYHGIVYTQKFGQGGAYITKAVAQLMRDFGASPAPMNAWLLGMGMETLPLRMARHSQNGLGMAQFLQDHPKVAWVRYPGLPGDKYYALAQKYLPKGASGVVSFGVKGGREAAERFMAGLKLCSIATHVADAKTCVLHPANTTHRQMNDAELAAAGVAPDLIRLSVGLEDLDDLVSDVEQALAGV
ncbi:MAG TPA: O-acetylhomoserine aminocarboxypropyltransferase/cysteine synthase [Candidatus Enterenecus merdae]|nr:O-acetylhomoserine aminocarboxypropyltransferase/cysteine synthase [Candidatus Enterenecus merdae]